MTTIKWDEWLNHQCTAKAYSHPLRISSSLAVSIWLWGRHDRPMFFLVGNRFVDLSDAARSFLVVIGRNIREYQFRCLPQSLWWGFRWDAIEISWMIYYCTELMKRACRCTQFRVFLNVLGKANEELMLRISRLWLLFNGRTYALGSLRYGITDNWVCCTAPHLRIPWGLD